VPLAGQILIQICIDASPESRINLNQEVNLQAINSTSLGPDVLSVTTADVALTALDNLNASISVVTAGRGKVGAVQNRLVRTIANLSISVENLTTAESAIRCRHRGRNRPNDPEPDPRANRHPQWWGRPTSYRIRCCSYCSKALVHDAKIKSAGHRFLSGTI
jgi:hypothetical protein